MLILQQMKQQVLTIDWLAMKFFCVYRMGKMGAQLNKCIQYFVNGNDYNSFITCWIYIYAFIYLFILTILFTLVKYTARFCKGFFSFLSKLTIKIEFWLLDGECDSWLL